MVLHRPVESTRVIGNLAASTPSCREPRYQALVRGPSATFVSKFFVRRRPSWFRVICGVGMAAGILSGREFHDFDARAVGIVDIEMDFSLFLTVTFSRQPG